MPFDLKTIHTSQNGYDGSAGKADKSDKSDKRDKFRKHDKPDEKSICGEFGKTTSERRKAALITGAGVGIGRGIAYKLADAGYDIAVNFNSSCSEAEEVCESINSSCRGVKAVPIKADISDIAQVKMLFAEFGRHFGSLDLFVNNAGITKKESFLDTDEAMFDQICGVNFKGAFFCVQKAAKYMITHNTLNKADNNNAEGETKGDGPGTLGSVVVISSNHYAMHSEDVSLYGSVKAALNKMAEHAALELAKYGIRVNIIAPGWTDTGAPRMAPKEGTLGKIPLKRWCTPEEIGEAVLFISSPHAASVTGACLMIDGGAWLI